jgi:hypothetical protein
MGPHGSISVRTGWGVPEVPEVPSAQGIAGPQGDILVIQVGGWAQG